MGQPVNPLLGNQQALLGADPELYRQQLIQQEQARINALPAQNQLGATLGSLLGRGLVNVAQDRGFFEVTNPVLQNLTKIQSVYNTAMQAADPNDPLSFYRELQTRFADAGLGQQAFMAQQEGRKVEGEVLKTKSARAEYFKSNPDLINAEIDRLTQLGTPQALAEADSFKELKTRISRDQEFKLQSGLLDLAAKESTIEVNKAKIEEIRREAKEGKVNIAQFAATPTSPAYVAVFRNGRLENQFPVGTSALDNMPGGVPTKPGEKKETPKAIEFDKRTVPSSSAAAPTQATASAPVPGMQGGINPFNKDTGTYKLSFNPVINNLLTARNAPGQSPQAIQAIDQTLQQQIIAIQQQYPGVNFID
jgi:hypothetical protein